MKKYIIILLAIVFLASCKTGKEPINGWHKRDHWYSMPSNWHTKSHPANF